MNITALVMGLLGGLALFLYGMHMMSSGMEAAAGNKMKRILEKLTKNPLLGVGVGAAITAVIQSSSATTVMVVGFVNSGMMTLRQAVWIIMGANIGTTITGQLIALDAGAIAPVIAFIGVALIVFVKNQKAHHIGSILAGLGVLFIGMDIMGEAMRPLSEVEGFKNILTNFSNPFLGILAGTIFTAIIQSSSASVGILQTLAASGAISFSNSVFVLFGQNIGTCVTALLASIGTNRNAKRTTVIHLSFNIIGTVIFTIICIYLPLTGLIEKLTPGGPKAQIANMHTIFNIATTLIILPFGAKLASLAERILPDKEEEDDTEKLLYLNNIKLIRESNIGLSAITLEQVHNEMERMMGMATNNVNDSFTAFIERDSSIIAKVEKSEDYVDYLNKEISKSISAMMTHEMNEKGSLIFSSYFKITGNVERISDHAMNICSYADQLNKEDLSFSQNAIDEIYKMQEICNELLSSLFNEDGDAVEALSKVAALEQKIDDMTKEYRNNMINRIKNGTCNEESSIFYSEMLTDFERIGDHALNISQYLTDIRLAKE